MNLTLKYGVVQKEYKYKSTPLPSALKYAIIKHRYEGRGGNLTFYPDTCPFGDAPNSSSGKGTSIPIYPEWWRFIRKINNDAGYDYARSIGNMWINNQYDQDDSNPQPPATAESIGCGGNFVAFDQRVGNKVHAICYNRFDNADLLDPAVDNWKNKPWMIWKACAVNESLRVINVGNALDVYIPMIARTEFWIHTDWLEMLPDGYDYRFDGVNVYDGNQPLLTVENGVRTFHTAWRINTTGVVPPAE
jgi:hypothetical protein